MTQRRYHQSVLDRMKQAFESNGQKKLTAVRAEHFEREDGLVCSSCCRAMKTAILLKDSRNQIVMAVGPNCFWGYGVDQDYIERPPEGLDMPPSTNPEDG